MMNIHDVFVIPEKKPSAKLRLFLFPFAGGGISTYMPWCSSFNQDVELVLVQPPGRGARMAEKAFDDMNSLVAEILKSKALIHEMPCIFFGHSLGSRIAYETCCQLGANQLALPLHLIVSGSKAAHINDKPKHVHDLPEQAFITELRRLNGTPAEILENSEILSLLIPLLRADFKISECYKAEGNTIHTPITALGGEQDVDVDLANLSAWEALTTSNFEVNVMRGDHFFINTNRDAVIHEVKKVVAQCLEKVTASRSCPLPLV